MIYWFLEYEDQLLKFSIIPRSIGVLGYAQCLLKEVCLHIQEQIMHTVCMVLEGLFWKSNNMIANNQVNDVDDDDVVKATTDSIFLIHILEENFLDFII